MDEKAVQIMLDVIATTRKEIRGDKKATRQLLKDIGLYTDKMPKVDKKQRHV